MSDVKNLEFIHQMMQEAREPFLTALREWRAARIALCASKIDTPECHAAFVRLGHAEHVLSKLVEEFTCPGSMSPTVS